jgi:hypothetical protein
MSAKFWEQTMPGDTKMIRNDKRRLFLMFPPRK